MIVKIDVGLYKYWYNVINVRIVVRSWDVRIRVCALMYLLFVMRESEERSSRLYKQNLVTGGERQSICTLLFFRSLNSHWSPLEETYLRRELERIREVNESERISFLIETLSNYVSNCIIESNEDSFKFRHKNIYSFEKRNLSLIIINNRNIFFLEF